MSIFLEVHTTNLVLFLTIRWVLFACLSLSSRSQLNNSLTVLAEVLRQTQLSLVSGWNWLALHLHHQQVHGRVVWGIGLNDRVTVISATFLFHLPGSAKTNLSLGGLSASQFHVVPDYLTHNSHRSLSHVNGKKVSLNEVTYDFLSAFRGTNLYWSFFFPWKACKRQTTSWNFNDSSKALISAGIWSKWRETRGDH